MEGKVSYIETKGMTPKVYQNESLFLSVLQRDRHLNLKNQGGHSVKRQKLKNQLIDQQNERILKVLKESKGTIDFSKLEDESLQKQKVSFNMQKFSSGALRTSTNSLHQKSSLKAGH